MLILWLEDGYIYQGNARNHSVHYFKLMVSLLLSLTTVDAVVTFGFQQA